MKKNENVKSTENNIKNVISKENNIKNVILKEKKIKNVNTTGQKKKKENVEVQKEKTDIPVEQTVNKEFPSVLFISSEVSPFAKVGGLADVVGSLPGVLCQKGCDVRVIMPFYRKIKQKYLEKATLVRWAMIKIGWRSQYSGLFTLKHDGVIYYFIDNEYFFGNDKIYIDYTFDMERFCFFQRAVLEALGEPMGFEPDILHCNDWQAGMIPCLLKAHFQSSGFHEKMKTVFTIHNLKYQGIHSKEMISDLLDLPLSYFNDFGVIQRGDPNFMKAGIVYSDAITTVSETYAGEILTPEYGEGLDGVLWNFTCKIKGIINGIDLQEYDPQKDPYIPLNFNKENVSENKAFCKAALQKELHLPLKPDIPLAGMITRLVDQKGLDLLLFIIEELLDTPIQIVILGTGDPYYENVLTELALRRPKQLSVSITFDNPLAHRIYAGSDVFLMPSLFEPCGLSQMISMQYGTIPIVRETGGLKDTVKPYNEFTGEGTGFSFKNINAHELLFTTKYACDVYKNKKEAWAWLMRNGMESDFSWNNSASKYLELYRDVIK